MLDVALQCTQRQVVLAGPSGAGKSLTLKAVAGLLRPGQGARPDADAVHRHLRGGAGRAGWKANALVILTSVVCIVILLLAARLVGGRRRELRDVA